MFQSIVLVYNERPASECNLRSCGVETYVSIARSPPPMLSLTSRVPDYNSVRIFITPMRTIHRADATLLS
jgi:hypothetical protein